MSVFAASQVAPPIAMFHDLDHTFIEDIDWGSATPINTITELELDSEYQAGILKRMSKRVSFGYDSKLRIPSQQKALVLHSLRVPFILKEDHPVPVIKEDSEVIVMIQAIGLNPIDWKSADFGYSIPEVPYVSGRDFAGVVMSVPAGSTLEPGDVVLCPSTDYRDQRKAAYQEYAIATTSTVCRIPSHMSTSQGAAVGVAYVAAALALGVCLGLRMPNIGSFQGPDLLEIVRNTPLGRLPRDVVVECLVDDADRPTPDEWLIVWGGSSTSALLLAQIARFAGLKVILVLDIAKHGSKLPKGDGFVFVDGHSPERTVDVIRGITKEKARLGIDTVGPKTASYLARCLEATNSKSTAASHVVGLAALPKERLQGVGYHAVPVKLFHEVAEMGRSSMAWLEKALESRLLSLPRVEEVPGGLEGINAALDQMRSGQVSGKRLVVPL